MQTEIYKLISYAVIAVGMVIPQRLPGQSLLDEVNFKSQTGGGIHLYGVSVYSGYMSSAYPMTGALVSAPVPGAGDLGPDMTYGAQATVGWQHHGQRTNFSLMYSGGYSGMARYTDLSAFSQSLLFDFSRDLSKKWTLSVAGSGQDSTLAQFLNQPSTLSVVAQLPATFDDLAAAFSIGQFSNAQAASMLTGAPILQSPLQPRLLGNRILSYSLRATVEYRHSSRLSFHFGSLSAGGQNLPNAQNGGARQPNYVMQHSIGANAGLGMSYALSPRTHIAIDAEETRLVNRYQSGYTTTASASLGRKMGTHWFLRIRGGGSLARITQQLYGTPSTRSVVGGSSIGFQTYQHTLVASYDRASYTTYGFAIGINTTTSGSWSWRRPGSRWGFLVSFAQQQMRGTGFLNLSGRQASAGLSQSLNTHTTVTTQYSYVSSTGNDYLGALSNFTIHSVRVVLNWSPEVAQRR